MGLSGDAEGEAQEGESPSGDTGVEVIDATTTAYIDLTGLVDPKKQAVKLEKRAAEVGTHALPYPDLQAF